MNLAFLFIFLSSLYIGLLTIVLILVEFGFSKGKLFFIFIPSIYIYLGFISFFLSLFNLLDAVHFLLIQLVLMLGTFFLCKNKLPDLQEKKLNIKKKFRQFSALANSSFINFFLIIILTLILLLSLLIRNKSPVYQFDDKMYRASTPLFWIQNKSVFRFETFNQRKNVFLYGSGLVYMWPMLFQVNENIALILYWLAFPLSILVIYYFSEFFTNKVTVRLFSAVIYAITPIIFEYYSYSLVQESWLGLLLLSSVYFLFLDLKSESKTKEISICVGLILGLLGFIKLTGWFYFPIFLLSYFYVFKYKAINKLKYVFIGFIISFFITGNFLAVYQNIKLYSSPFGSVGFQQEHLSDRSLKTIKIQAARIPFLFLEFPVFSKYLTEKVENFFQVNSKILGATAFLVKENENWWIGKYQYDLSPINKRFSVGGIIWFFSPLVVLYFYKKNSKMNINYFVYLTFFSIVILQLFITKWAEGSDVPSRHLLSSYLIACSFFPLIFSLFDKYLSRKISYIFLCLLLIISMQRLLFEIENLDKLLKPSLDPSPDRITKTQQYPYEDFLNWLEEPTSFLVEELPATQDYSLFWYKGSPQNKVYLTYNSEHLDNTEYSKKILSLFKEKQIEFLVLNNPSKGLYDNLIQLHFSKVTRIKPSLDYTIDILSLNKKTN